MARSKRRVGNAAAVERYHVESRRHGEFSQWHGWWPTLGEARQAAQALSATLAYDAVYIKRSIAGAVPAQSGYVTLLTYRFGSALAVAACFRREQGSAGPVPPASPEDEVDEVG